MKFIEIEEKIVNTDSIRSVEKVYLDTGNRVCLIEFIDKNDNHLLVNELYYNKLKELLKPIHLANDKEYINVSDFPGDNMIEE